MEETPTRDRIALTKHISTVRKIQTVAVGGLGAVGLEVARALDVGIEGLQLIAVAARDRDRARCLTTGFRTTPPIIPLSELAEAEIVVEALPAAIFEEVAAPAIECGRVFVPASVGALLPRLQLVERARATGARIVIPTGALLGLDAVRAAAEGEIESITLETRKPPAGLLGAPYLDQHGIDLHGIDVATRVFSGNVQEAVAGFPANVNVAAALALAGI